MGSPYLSNNETIVLSTHNIVINTIPSEAILTSHRLMLLDYSHPQILPQDIPFGAIETVMIGENSIQEPVLSLSVVAPDGARHTLGMTFSQPLKTKRGAERDEWAAKLKEMSLAAQQEHGTKHADLLPPWVPGEPVAEENKDAKKASQSENVYRPLKPQKKQGRSSSTPKITRGMAAGAVILVLVIAAIGGSWFLAPSLWGKAGGVAVPAPTPVTTPVATTVPTPEPTETPLPVTSPVPVETVTPAVTATPVAAPKASVPQTGVWIHVIYDGKFSGSIGTSGGLRNIAGSNEGLYQIPVTEGMLLATVEKLDTSGKTLTVEFYKDGTLLKSSTTKTPKGTVDAQAMLPVTPTSVIVRANGTTRQ